MVREELDRLPENYRAPLILCYLEGLTHEEAARHLGWASGTVKVRLVRGRKLLRERLDRRRIALGAGILLIWRHEVAASPPGDLLESTVQHARKERPIGTNKNPRVVSLLKGAIDVVNRPMISLVVLALISLAILWGIFEGVALAYQPPVASIEMEDLPANLTDVLAVDCR